MAKKKTSSKAGSKAGSSKSNGGKSSSSKSNGKSAAGTLAPVGSAAEFERFLPEARKIAKSAVIPMRADVNLAITNARRGAQAVLSKKAQLKAELPGVSLDHVQNLGSLALAVAYAENQVERFAPPPRQVKKMLARAHVLRHTLLASAEALASAGLVAENAVAKIRHGRGGIDAAGDCVALASLFRRNAAAIRGKHPLSTAEIKEAADLGSQLLGVLEPKSARRDPSSLALRQARDSRDRLWTLLEQRWEQDVWRAGAWLYGRDGVDKHVPPLLSRAAHRSKKKKKPAAASAQAAE